MAHYEAFVFLCFSDQDPQELLHACKQGDLEVVLQSLAADVDVDTKDTVRILFVVDIRTVLALHPSKAP